ncbi:MAG: hypothetical protein A2Z27_04625 [candidate division Zixibacteria bacterium RBG_16_50_21]|nr:MAG: hypothetical protein A2Z27_04625 [candidate division Zixibacteria bacterium RBG_16_50_21]
MPKKKKPDTFKKPSKELWIKQSLQSLTPQKVNEIVNNIINGELCLHKRPDKKSGQTQKRR